MTLILEYSNSKDDLQTQCELHLKEYYKSSRSNYIRSTLASFALLILASYCAYQAELIGFLVFFLVVAVSYLFQLLQNPQIYRSSIETSLAGWSETQIKMEVREDGLFETEEGIESFVPWSSVKSYTLFSDTLFIYLSARLCAIIPCRSVSPSPSSVDELIRVLQEKGIPETD